MEEDVPLIKKVERFKADLNVNGANARDVILATAAELGVPTEGQALGPLATACWKLLYGDGDEGASSGAGSSSSGKQPDITKDDTVTSMFNKLCLTAGEESAAAYTAARSVHLWWSSPDSAPSVFYSEVTVQDHVPGSFFMCCGFDGGYFGIQDNDGQTKTVLFSVWDASDAENDASHSAEDRVQIPYEAAHVRCQRFGGEGTGAQCIDQSTRWEVGQTMRMMVMHYEEPDGHACYGAWVSSEVAPDWVHLASYRVRNGRPFGGFYSFVEDFRRDGESVAQLRRALYGPSWTWSENAGWMAATEASFTASNSPVERPDTIDTEPGSEPGTQVLANGGDLAGAAKLNWPPFALKPGTAGPPTLPAGMNPTTVFTTAAPVSPTKLLVLKPDSVATNCPLCHIRGDCAPFCGGDCCLRAQCQGSDAPFPGEQCIWKCADGPLCHFHASGGKKCPLCGYTNSGEGPFCFGDCCGSSQCQGSSPFMAGKRCDWACAQGAKCAYHANQ